MCFQNCNAYKHVCCDVYIVALDIVADNTLECN